MSQTKRFGRKVPLPSTRQIIHELLVISAQEDANRQRSAAEDASTPAAKPAGPGVATV